VAGSQADWPITTWDRAHAGELAALVAAALPEEELSEDELLAVCWDDPGPDGVDARPDDGVVLALADGTGAAVGVLRSWGDPTAPHKIGYVKLLVVHPEARRAGRGHALLDAVERWAWEHGASELQLSGSAPFYLWPGVDATATEMLCLAEARGYRPFSSDVNMALPTTFRAEAPAGTTVRRVIDDADVALVRALVETHWPEWWPETARAIEHGCCHGVFVAASDGGAAGGAGGGTGDGSERAIGFGCHSVNRAGWLGPMGTDPDARAGGVGQALLGQICRDLMIADFTHTEISWVGPVRFYAKSGATVSRVFRGYRLRRPTAI